MRQQYLESREIVMPGGGSVDEMAAAAQEMEAAKRAYEEAQRKMVAGRNQGLPAREMADLTQRKNDAWRAKEAAVSRHNEIAKRAAREPQ